MIEQILSLPPEQKIGQLFFIGLPGAEIDAQTREILQKISPGGICLFTRNIRSARQTRNLLDQVRAHLPVEPFLSLDQEGGLVDRLRRIITPMPSAQAVSRKGNVELAENLARITAEIVRRLGFNMNFAPVVDVVDEEREKFSNGLYSRGFGKSKEEAAHFARVYLKRLQAGGCLGCLKHFPGYGAAQTDSHDELPGVNLSRRDLFEKDLFPYLELFPAGQVQAVMIGHAVYPLFDLQERDALGRFLPSSLSRNIIDGFLRRELGYQNLVLTDDLEMGAIVKNYGLPEAAKMAVEAGNDFLLICANPQVMLEAYDAVKRAVEAGEISEDRIKQSLVRIARVKNLMQTALPFDQTRLDKLSAEVKKLNDLC